jgi:predicted small lipoprotein YifL
MPCLCPPPLECCYYGKCPACFLCGAPAVLAVLAALAGCGRSGSTQAPPPSAINTATYAPVFADTLPPVPADVPAEVPACPAQAPVMVHDQPGFYSACSSYTYSQSPVLDIYNLSDGVLDVTRRFRPGSPWSTPERARPSTTRTRKACQMPTPWWWRRKTRWWPPRRTMSGTRD